MAARTESPRVDEGLVRLLEVERGVDKRLRDAEDEARRRLEAARADAERTQAEARAELESAAREEEQADLARHAAELARIATEAAERVRVLSALPHAVIERLAREALAIVVGGDEPGSTGGGRTVPP